MYIYNIEIHIHIYVSLYIERSFQNRSYSPEAPLTRIVCVPASLRNLLLLEFHSTSYLRKPCSMVCCCCCCASAAATYALPGVLTPVLAPACVAPLGGGCLCQHHALLCLSHW